MCESAIQVLCPCCGARLQVEPASGQVQVLDALRPEEAGEGGERPRDLGEALRRSQERAVGRRSAFDEALEAERRRKKELEEHFRQARERASEDPERPPENPLDDRWR